MKKTILIILILSLICIVSVLANTASDPAGVNDMGFFSKWQCAYDYFHATEETRRLKAGTYGSGIGTSVLSFITASGAAVLDSIGITIPSTSASNPFCSYALFVQTETEYSENLTEQVKINSGTMNDQAGIEDANFYAEKKGIYANINGAWAYVILLFDIFIEVVLIVFYLMQLFMIFFILFVAIPTALLYVRDGMTSFFVKRSKRRDNR